MAVTVMAGGAAWSLADRALLRVLWADGLSGTEIGLRLGRTKNATIGQVHRLKLSARPSPLPCGSTTRNRNHAKIRATGATLAPLASLAGAGTIHVPTRSLAPRITAPSKRPATTPEPQPMVVRKGPQRTCEWLSGDKPYVRCSEPAEFNRPYCAFHCSKAYIRRSHAPEMVA